MTRRKEEGKKERKTEERRDKRREKEIGIEKERRREGRGAR